MAAEGDAAPGSNQGIFQDVYFAIIPSPDLQEETANAVWNIQDVACNHC